MDDTAKPIWPHGDTHKLTPHMGSGQWCRKINGKLKYFGRLADPDAALRNYLNFVAKEEAGKKVREAPLPASDITLYVAVNGFLTDRLELVEKKQASALQYVKYKAACKLVLEVLGRDTPVEYLTPEDFKTLRARFNGGPVSVGNQIACVRAMLNHAREHYGVRIRYGKAFRRPGKQEVAAGRRERILWTPQDIRAVLAVATPAMRCFILLGINCGFGQKDCAWLPRGSFDLEGHRFPRVKNGNKRLCPFWPETVAALCDYERPTPHTSHANLFFVTTFGNPWVSERVKTNAAGDVVRSVYKDSVSNELEKLCRKAGVAFRPFYDLRHTFYSVADEAGDPTARDAIMGHTLPGMKEVYSHLLANRMERLRKLTDRVHDWLFTG